MIEKVDSKIEFFLPTAVIIGPMRTGTSWIYGYLKSRKDNLLPKGVKETFFFDKHYKKGISWYASHFENSKSKKRVEVASSYFHSEKAPKRILATIGKVPILILKRNPVDRSYSHFKHLVRYGYTQDDINLAIQAYPEIISASQYHYHISRWQDVFGKENVYMLNFELIAERPSFFLKKLCSNVNIEYYETSFPKEKKINEGRLVKAGWINKIFTKAADDLRSIKMYSVVNFAKNIGLKEAVYGGKGLYEDKDTLKVKAAIKKELQKRQSYHA